MQSKTLSAKEIANHLVHQNTYMARTYRAHEAENPPPFKPIKLLVQKHKDETVIVTTADYGWAEMDPRQDARIEGGTLALTAEDYCLDIEISSLVLTFTV